MEFLCATLLAVCAFWLGACPFSVWVGRLVLDKDIRNYGDSNPGAANVFRAGSLKAGCLALVLDVAKGIPFVFLATTYFRLPEVAIVIVALSAILGHAFSPMLRFRGGKAIAVTYGATLALAEPEMLFVLAAFMFAAFLFIENHAWVVMFGPTGTLIYLLITRGTSWESFFILCVFLLLVVKHFPELKTVPGLKVKPIGWLQSRRRGV